MPTWITDAMNWFTEYWVWVAVGFALLADIIGALEMASIAFAKGYSRAKYFIICFFFTLLGYIIVIALPDVETAERNEEILETLHRVNGKLTRVNSGMKKLSAAPKQRLPEAVKRLAASPVVTPASRTRDAAPVNSTEYAAPKPAAKAAAAVSERLEKPSVKAEPAAQKQPEPAAEKEKPVVEEPTVEKQEAAPERRGSSAREILETVLQFETETGMSSYFRRKYEKADAATQASLESLLHISDERFRQAAEKLLEKL